jgi:hypothetical protein
MFVYEVNYNIYVLIHDRLYMMGVPKNSNIFDKHKQ